MATIHSDIQAYLLQQRQMYGDILYTDAVAYDASLVLAPDEAPRPQQKDESHHQQSAPNQHQVEHGGHVKTDRQIVAAFDAESMIDFNDAIKECLKCPLGFTRTNFVFGSGNPNADLMIIGEAPGADEDEQGLPFVGRAGQLLTKILEAVEFNRDDVYICNILKCRPPNNRKPLASETDTCEPYLRKQIDLVQPRFILALGLTAANTLLKNKESMTSLRGRMHDYHGIPTLVTYHPAALLRNPEWKKHTWEDVQHLKSLFTNGA
ncbi:MAG: uracil-DNA glycosylase [bacterium]|nr:uracil-DNA glycosylase [bacterium]